jgi:hypothetical protein
MTATNLTWRKQFPHTITARAVCGNGIFPQMAVSCGEISA